MNRREFIGTAAAFGGAAVLNGCACRPCAHRDRVPYADTIGDRLWMWGHHRDSFKALKGSKEQYNLPYETRIDMADACREMDIPGCFVVRWTDHPKAAELPEYMKQFRDLKRVGFSITDSASGSFEEKVRLGLEYADRMPNLTTLVMDDFWSIRSFTRSEAELAALRTRLADRNLRLGIVLYADKDKGVSPAYKPVLDLCDEITLWFWCGKNIGGIHDRVGRLRDLVGAEKPVLLGQYMYDFGGRRQMPGADMERQLAMTSRLLADRSVNGVIFHCTPLVDMNLDAVNVSRAWIRENKTRKWGL